MILIFQAAYCAISESVGLGHRSILDVDEDEWPIDTPWSYTLRAHDMDPHCVYVQFRSFAGHLYKVSWDTFGLLYRGSTSVDAVLERGLLHADSQGFFAMKNSEVEKVLHAHLGFCLKKGCRVTYDYGRGAPLQKDKHMQIFMLNHSRRWQVISPEDCRGQELERGEVRVLFARGGYCGYPAVGSENEDGRIVCRGTHRCARLDFEQEGWFVQKLKKRAQKELVALEKKSEANGERVSLRYVTAQGVVCGCFWDVSTIIDGEHRLLGDFLRYCVLLGKTLGYTDADAVRHYAFFNEHMRRVLVTCLVLDLCGGVRVQPRYGMEPLSVHDLIAMPVLSWTIAPSGELRRPQISGSCALTFAGVTFEGVPILFQDLDFPYSFFGEVTPRNYLWAFDHAELAQRKPQGVSWYDAHLQSTRALWIDAEGVCEAIESAVSPRSEGWLCCLSHFWH